MGSNLWRALKAFNLFKLLENEIMEMFNMGERSKSKRKFGWTKVCETDEVRQYFINPKIENEVFGKCVNLVRISEIFHASLVKIYRQN